MGALPSFRYYADPVADGRIVPSMVACDVCETSRGWLAPDVHLYTAQDTDGLNMCPWCIADGSAARRHGGTFNDLADRIDDAAQEMVEQRTPNFPTWQDWEWPIHCDDGMVYLGQPAGAELRAQPTVWDAFVGEIARECRMTPDDAAHFVEHMGPDRSAVAYLFRCRWCDHHVVRWDQD